MIRCHICGKAEPYTEMVDHITYSVHPKCQYRLLYISHNIKEFQNCSTCKERHTLPKEDLRNHLITNHTKEGLTDLIIDLIH
jgi:hypothetical protein